MEQTNKDVFDEVDAADTVTVPANTTTSKPKAKTLAELNAEKAVIVPTPAFEFGEAEDTEQLEIQLKDEDKAKVFTIASVELLKPRMQDENGSFIPPAPFNPAKPDQVGYKSKMKIRYEGTDYVSYIPGLRWYPKTENGKSTLNPWWTTSLTKEDLDNTMASTLGKLYFRYSEFVKNDKLTSKQFKEGLVGKKVKLAQYKSKFEGRVGYRIDIAEFVA